VRFGTDMYGPCEDDLDVLLLLIACLVLASMWLILSAVRRRGAVSAPNLGWMSEQWLLQYHASRS